MKEFTVKYLAKILEVSKPTIQRAITAAAISASREEGQTRYYDLEAAAAISAKVKPNFDFLACVGDAETPPHEPPQTETPPQNTETDRKTKENEAEHTETEPPQTETPPQSESVELMKSMLLTIQEQLAIKDKQIAAYEAQIALQNEQIKDYSARLREAMQLTHGQQYLAAADKQAELLGAAAAAEVIHTEEPLESADSPAPQIGETRSDAAAPKKSFFKRLFGKE